MTKLRAAVTFEHALTRIAAQLTVEGMAAAIDRSEGLIRKWMDPERPGFPNLEQALALDAAFGAAGGQGAPLLETYARQLDCQLGDALSSRIILAAQIATAAKESGEAIAHSLAVVQPSSGPRELERAKGEVEEAQSSMAVVARSLSKFQQLGAGPGLDAVGGAQ